MKIALIPYLVFDGATTREAMEFYHSIFGGNINMQTFGEAGMAKDDSEKDLIIHAELRGEGFSFMASSGHPGVPVKFGDNISMSLIGEDETTLTDWFNKLAEGGEITLKLEKQ